jgi:hypothetical protein
VGASACSKNPYLTPYSKVDFVSEVSSFEAACGGVKWPFSDKLYESNVIATSTCPSHHYPVMGTLFSFASFFFSIRNGMGVSEEVYQKSHSRRESSVQVSWVGIVSTPIAGISKKGPGILTLAWMLLCTPGYKVVGLPRRLGSLSSALVSS